MPSYSYRAIDQSGRYSDGVIEASGVGEAVAILEKRGLTVESIAIASGETLADRGAGGPTNDGTDFTQGLGLLLADPVERLLAAREQILPPLDAYIDESPPGQRRGELRAIAQAIASNDPTAAAEAATQAPGAWAPLLAAAGGDEDSLFGRFVQRERPLDLLKRRRRLAYAYPLVVTLLAIVVFSLLATFVVPTFRPIFESFGLELPGMTELVLWASGFFHMARLPFVLIIGLLLAVAWDRVIGWPFRPKQGRAFALSQIARLTADLHEARVPAHESLGVAGDQVGGRYGRRASEYAADLRMKTPGRPPSSLLGHALAIDTSHSCRISLLREIASLHQDQTETKAAWARGVAGPMATGVLGLLVGFVALSLFLPLVKLVEGLT